MKKTKIYDRTKGRIAISEIILLVVAIFAISWMVGSSVEVVSALPGDICTDASDCGVNTCSADGSTANVYVCDGGVCLLQTDHCGNGCENGHCLLAPDPGEGEDLTPADEGFDFGDVLETGKSVAKAVAVEVIEEKIKKKGIGNWIREKLGMKPKMVQNPEFIGPPEMNPADLEQTFFQKLGSKLGLQDWSFFSGGEVSGFTGVASVTVINAALAVGLTTLITSLANKYSSVRNAGDISTVAWTSTAVATTFTAIWATAGFSFLGFAGPPGWFAALAVGIAVGVYMLVGYQLYSQQVSTYQTSLWQPPIGGEDCERCNTLEINGENVCSEYICHTYGTTCEWFVDEPDYGLCVEVRQDGIPPRITPLEEVYGEPVFNPPEDYSYQTSSAGTRIVYHDENGCVPAFTPIKIAFETNERANCRIDIVPHDGEDLSDEQIFNNMMPMAEGSIYGYNHTIDLSSIVSASDYEKEAAGYATEGGHEFYVRCVDRGGTYNTHDYSISFCVDEGPDLYPPEIIGANPEEGSYISYGVETLENFIVFTNKPAICKWGFQPASFAAMPYEFDRCSMNINDPILAGSYDFGCIGEITGINPGQENSFYVVCVDQPILIGTPRENERNEGDPYEIVYIGSEPLEISVVAVNEQPNNSVIRDNTENVDVLLEVITAGGAENGNSRCSYSRDPQVPRNYNPFYNGGSFSYISTNSQPLYLSPGNYKYNIQCEDVAGNLATTMVNFSVEIDLAYPQVVRVYKDGGDLVLITDEKADCVYNLFSCDYDFEEGNSINTQDGLNHRIAWDSENDFYIKCRDANGIAPGNTECSLIARPFEIPDIQDFGE